MKIFCQGRNDALPVVDGTAQPVDQYHADLGIRVGLHGADPAFEYRLLDTFIMGFSDLLTAPCRLQPHECRHAEDQSHSTIHNMYFFNKWDRKFTRLEGVF